MLPWFFFFLFGWINNHHDIRGEYNRFSRAVTQNLNFYVDMPDDINSDNLDESDDEHSVHDD